jgi:hypothetical protein
MSIRVELSPPREAPMVLMFSALCFAYATCPFDMTSMMEYAINARLLAAFYRDARLKTKRTKRYFEARILCMFLRAFLLKA